MHSAALMLTLMLMLTPEQTSGAVHDSTTHTHTHTNTPYSPNHTHTQTPTHFKMQVLLAGPSLFEYKLES